MNLETAILVLFMVAIVSPFLWILRYSAAQISGLLQLATHYKVRKHGRGPNRSFVTLSSARPSPHRDNVGAIAGNIYPLGFYLKFTDDGLVVAPMFSFLTHIKPLLLPYQDIAGARVRGVFKDGFELTTIAEPDIVLEFSGLGGWMEKHLNRRGVDTFYALPD